MLSGGKNGRGHLRRGRSSDRDLGQVAITTVRQSPKRSSARLALAGLAFRSAVLPAPFLDFLLGLFLGDSVALHDLADQLVAAAVDLAEVIIGQLAPSLLG